MAILGMQSEPEFSGEMLTEEFSQINMCGKKRKRDWSEGEGDLGFEPNNSLPDLTGSSGTCVALHSYPQPR